MVVAILCTFSNPTCIVTCRERSVILVLEEKVELQADT